LKELEKYGFKNKCGTCWKPKKGTWEVMEIKIDLKTKIITMPGLSDMFHTREDTLYDLIKADLVEKTED
jgi:hypothetical protein